MVSEKYRDNKKGGRSREDLVMGLTQHMTVIIMPEGSQWSQVSVNQSITENRNEDKAIYSILRAT